MTDGFQVDPDLLDEHARAVRALAARVRRSAVAARPLALGGYGVLGQVFAVAAAQAAHAGSAAVARLAARATADAEELQAAAGEYRRVEREVAAGIGGRR